MWEEKHCTTDVLKLKYSDNSVVVKSKTRYLQYQ